jgi:hypothetical protein
MDEPTASSLGTTTSRWPRFVRKALLVLALTPVTLVVLGALSGAARADVGDLLDPVASDELARANDVGIQLSGQLVKADAGTDGAEVRVDAVGAKLNASVGVDDGSVALFLQISPIVEEKPGDPRSPERSHRQVNAADEREGPRTGSGARRSGWGRDAASSISGADRDDDGAAITPARHPLGRPLDVVSGSAGRATTSSAHDGPDVPGLLERLHLHRHGPGRPITSAIAVFTVDLVPSTGPPG